MTSRIIAVVCSLFTAAGTAAIVLLSGGAAVASAATAPAPPCAANHGAPGGFPANSGAISQQNDPDFGLEQGATTTGLANATDCGNAVPSQAAIYG